MSMTSPTKFYYVIQVIADVACDQCFVTVAFLWDKLSQPQFYKDFSRKTKFLETSYAVNMILGKGSKY